MTPRYGYIFVKDGDHMGRMGAGVTKRADGRYMGRFSVNGTRYTVYGKSSSECKKKEQEIRQELEEGTMKKGKDLTFAEYTERFIDNHRDTVKPTTIRAHKIKIKRICECRIDYAKNVFGNLKLRDIETDHVRAVQRSLFSRGLQATTVNITIGEIRTILKDAVYDRILSYNPADGVRPLKSDTEKARDTIHRSLSVHEVKAFFDIAQTKSQYYNLYKFLISTGCRVGEAGALTYEDVRGGVITINKTITRDEDGNYIIGDSAKTKAGMRSIPLTPMAKEALDAQKKDNFERFGSESFSKEHLYFWNAKGECIDATHVGQDVKRMCRLAGIEKFTTHAFRDTFATKCIESGMTMKTLQEILGHSDITLTMNLYVHCTEETKVKEMANVTIAI